MLIKLVDLNYESAHNNVRWDVGATVEIPQDKRARQLCSPGILHVYEGNVALALMLDPIHVAHKPNNIRALEVIGEIVLRAGAVKAGGYSFKVLRELPVPTITLEHRVLFAIMCAFEASAGTKDPDMLAVLAEEACK